MSQSLSFIGFSPAKPNREKMTLRPRKTMSRIIAQGRLIGPWRPGIQLGIGKQDGGENDPSAAALLFVL
jgi:hypothetical protein